jgi:hypothetical protein
MIFNKYKLATTKMYTKLRATTLVYRPCQYLRSLEKYKKLNFKF